MESNKDNPQEKQQQTLEELFSDFKEQVIDISDHADQVYRLDFAARLKNGTAFSFNFNSDQWARKASMQEAPETGKYSPASPFNAVLDIIGALIAIALMISMIVHLRTLPTFGVVGTLHVLVFSLFTAYFVLASLFHLFPCGHQIRTVFLNLTMAFKIVTLLLINILTAILIPGVPNSLILIFISIFVAALALFLLSLGTKGGGNVSLACASVIPFLLFIIYPNFPPEDVVLLLPYLIPEAIMLGLWSFLPLILPSKISGKTAQGKTNNIFPIMGMCCMFFLLETIFSLGI